MFAIRLTTVAIDYVNYRRVYVMMKKKEKIIFFGVLTCENSFCLFCVGLELFIYLGAC